MLRLVPVVIGLVSCALAQTPAPSFRPASLFGDHMVLPAATDAPIWGRGEPGASIAVRASWGAEAVAAVDAGGRWRTALRTPARGGPFEVTLSVGAVQQVLRDVVVGDVWLASGQSNMEMALGKHSWSPGVRGYQQELAAADLPMLRVFTVVRGTATTPRDEVEGHWVVSAPATAAPFSATAWLFAAELVRSGHGPIGVVVSSWGGTVAEAWMRPVGLAAFPEFAAQLARQQAGGTVGSADQQRQRFWAAVDAAPAAAAASDVTMPDLWSRSGLGDFDGVVHYRRTVELPAELRGRDCWLELGAIDDLDTVFWNGERLGGAESDGAWATPRRYRVPAQRTEAATVALHVRVVDTGGEGGFSGDAAQLRVLAEANGAAAEVVLPLAGTWQRTRGASLRELPPWSRQDDGPNRPAVLWNAMIAPLQPFPFTGAIWYQGESNRHRHQQYMRLFPALIEDWRAAFGRELPFYFVQIAPFGYDDDGRNGGELTARLREAQAAALQLPRTGMVVTLDCGDAEDIHPIDKQPVGKRLAALARARHYGDAVPCEGPVLVAATAARAVVTLRFRATDGGLVLRDEGAGFELAGGDGRFVAATARVVGETVELTAPGIDVPRAVRYAWAAVPRFSLWNGAELPAAPFHRAIR